MLHATVVMKELGREKERLQHNIVDLSPGISTQINETFMVDGRKHIHTQTSITLFLLAIVLFNLLVKLVTFSSF